MALSLDELNQIHLRKLATPDKQYFGDNEKVYIGTSDGRLKLQDQAYQIPTTTENKSVQQALDNITTSLDKDAQDAVGSILVDTTEIDLTYNSITPSISAVLIETAVTPGTYGNATNSPAITVDSKGRITNAVNTPISITGLGTALTKTDDTNVTLTLGGSATTALVNAASITVGWSGTLSGTRGGTGVNNGSNTITLGGNVITGGIFITSGASSLTLTTTGATNITLPTTGTISTLAGAETFTNKISYNGLVITSNTATITTGIWNGTIIGNSYIATALSSKTYEGNTISTGTGTLTLSTFTLTVGGTSSVNGTFSGTSSGTNTGDQTTVSGNAGTATALQNARTIGGVSFDGTANIVPQTIQSVNEATDTTCYPLFISASGTQSLQPLNNAGLIYNSNTNALTATTFVGALTGAASLNLLTANNLSDLAAYATGRTNLGLITLVPTGDPTTTSSGAGTITGLTFTAVASTVYLIEWDMHIQCNNTGGVKFTVTIPSGTLYLNGVGTSTGATVYQHTAITTSGTLTGTAYCQEANLNRGCRFVGTLTIGVTGGTVNFQFASGTNTQTSTAYTEGSFVKIQKQ